MRTAMKVGAVVAGVVLLAGCSGSGDRVTVAATSRAAAVAPTSAAPIVAPTSPAPVGNGCPSDSARIPKGAHVKATQDLDLDGAKDELWLADVGSTRTLGVRTDTGAVFSTRFTSAAPQAASAIGARLEGTDASVVLLNTGRSVALYAVVDCELVPAKNKQGDQYTFDLGFTGYGTGVTCPSDGGGLTLAGLLAEPSGADYTVTRTEVELTDFGRTARNGRVTTLAEGVPVSDPAVKQAMTVTCGAKNPPVTEPEG